jgi:predicted RNA-binding Zn-ribbon protein involved in translation (DUF1610 family)
MADIPNIEQEEAAQDEFNYNNCPECGSSNVFDLETKYECDDCGFVWTKQN